MTGRGGEQILDSRTEGNTDDRCFTDLDYLTDTEKCCILITSYNSETEPDMSDHTPPSPFDPLDYHIIQELHHNVRADAAKIARAIGANERTVRKRIEHLISLDAIRLTAIINPRAFGYVTIVEIFLEVEPEEEEEALKRFLRMQEIAYVAYGEGSRDISIRARFRDNDEMREFLRRTLPAVPGVKVTGSVLVPRVLWDMDTWIPKPEDFGAESGGEGDTHNELRMGTTTN
jgi:DNA-binding Lrp family transcriptional regulator